jgi:hypothetical protein
MAGERKLKLDYAGSVGGRDCYEVTLEDTPEPPPNPEAERTLKDLIDQATKLTDDIKRALSKSSRHDAVSAKPEELG